MADAPSFDELSSAFLVSIAADRAIRDNCIVAVGNGMKQQFSDEISIAVQNQVCDSQVAAIIILIICAVVLNRELDYQWFVSVYEPIADAIQVENVIKAKDAQTQYHP